MIKRTFFIFGFCFGLFFRLFFSFFLFLGLRLSLHHLLLLFALPASFLYFRLGVFISNSPRDGISKDHSCLRGRAQHISVCSGFETSPCCVSS